MSKFVRLDSVESLVCFFNDPATTEISTLPLHDSLPISGVRAARRVRAVRSAAGRSAPLAGEAVAVGRRADGGLRLPSPGRDRNSTRLNSSQPILSDVVFCFEKKKQI